MKSLTCILGNTREIQRVYADGSFDCPFCHSAVIAPKERCENPWCAASSAAMANPASKPHFEAQAAKAAADKAAAEERQRNHEAAMRRIREENAARNERIRLAIEEARKRGACIRCMLRSYRGGYGDPKFIKHRKECRA